MNLSSSPCTIPSPYESVAVNQSQADEKLLWEARGCWQLWRTVALDNPGAHLG